VALEAVQSGRGAPWALRYQFPGRWLAAATVAILAVVVAAALNLGRIDRDSADAPRIQSLAVLPLANLSGDPQQEYFADGMTEILITDLGRLPGLNRVIARGSVMRFKGTSTPLAEIARELKVDALITGAVVRSGDRVRVTAQLINSDTEDQLWTDRYERDLRDVLDLQNELTRAIAGQIRVQLAPEEQRRLAAAKPVNPEAHDAYLQGRFQWHKLSRQGLDLAEKYFELALEKDPNYAPASFGIGTVWAVRVNQGIARPSDGIPRWRQAVRKAVELDPLLPEARAHQAAITFYADWDWAAAETELQRAIQLNPNYPELRIWYAEFLQGVAGRLDEGIAEMRRILEWDPHNTVFQAWVAQALLFARHDDEAITRL